MFLLLLGFFWTNHTHTHQTYFHYYYYYYLHPTPSRQPLRVLYHQVDGLLRVGGLLRDAQDVLEEDQQLKGVVEVHDAQICAIHVLQQFQEVIRHRWSWESLVCV